MDFFWWLAHKMYRHKRTRKLARLCELLSFIVSSHAVSARINLGKGSKFYHHGLGCVSIQTVEIGNNTVIFQNVTLGAKWNGVGCVAGGGGSPLVIMS